jgi:peptidyl-prolyl cis-trans isomerase D
MLEFVRTRVKNSIFLKIFLGVLALSFGIFGVGDFVGGPTLAPSIALKVDKVEVRTETLQRHYRREMDRFAQAMGGQNFDNALIQRTAMNSLIQSLTSTATLKAASQEMGVTVTREQLRDLITKLPVFQVDGKFSQSRFYEALQQIGVPETTFLDELESDVRQQMLIEPLVANAAAPKYLVDSLYDYRGETRVADTLLLPASALTVDKKPTEDELKALYDQNVAAFTLPEYRRVVVLTLVTNDLVKPESIDDAEVKKYYDDNLARYSKPASKRISQIVFDGKEQAEAARKQAAPGDTLQTLAAKAKTGDVIDLGELTKDSSLTKAIAPAFDLPVGEISQAIQTPLGWHLFEVKSETPEHIEPFDAVKENVRNTIASDKAVDAVYDASTRIEDAMAAGTPLQEIAVTVGGQITSFESIDHEGKDAQGAVLPNTIDPKNFIDVVFQTPEGKDSRLMDTANRDGYYVVHVEKVTPPTPQPLEKVRTQVVALWEKAERTKLADAAAAKVAADIGTSVQLSAVAAKDKRLSYAPLGPVTRFGSGLLPQHVIDPARVSTEMLEKLFKAKPGEIFTANVADGIVVARLTMVQTPSAAGSPATEQEQLSMSLRRDVGVDIIDQMAKAFAARYPAELNQTAIDQMITAR